LVAKQISFLTQITFWWKSTPLNQNSSLALSLSLFLKMLLVFWEREDHLAIKAAYLKESLTI
jgi:hypothetical protein